MTPSQSLPSFGGSNFWIPWRLIWISLVLESSHHLWHVKKEYTARWADHWKVRGSCLESVVIFSSAERKSVGKKVYVSLVPSKVAPKFGLPRHAEQFPCGNSGSSTASELWQMRTCQWGLGANGYVSKIGELRNSKFSKGVHFISKRTYFWSPPPCGNCVIL